MNPMKTIRLARWMAAQDGRDFEELTPQATDSYLDAAREALRDEETSQPSSEEKP